MCLLKGCESVFRPQHPLARYCRAVCRAAARQWRKWKAQQRYRKSPSGREKRQAQCRRNRKRRKANESARKLASAGVARVIPIGFFSCDRPGCYQLFKRTKRSPQQRFCSRACRLALERVLKRERRWRKGLARGNPRTEGPVSQAVEARRYLFRVLKALRRFPKMPRVYTERNRELLDVTQFSPESQRRHGMDLKQLKQRLSLLDYLRQQNWTLRPAGNSSEFVGLCPLHPETHPSFYVNTQKNLFYCHGCGQGGDLIRFVELFQHLSFRESLAYLERRNPPSTESVAAVLEETTAFYQRQLQDHEEARLYLAQRGVRDPALIQELRTGYAHGGNLRRHLTAQGFSLDLLRRTGLVNQQGVDAFYHRVVFPCCQEGRVVNLYGRSIGTAFPHRFLPGSRGGLFAWEAVRHFPIVILVEGLFDLAVLWQAGLRNSTCGFGTHLTPTQLRQLSTPPGRRVFLVYDQDENQAGQRASQALARQLQLLGAVVFLTTLPNGEDPNSYFVHGASAADFIHCLDGAQSL